MHGILSFIATAAIYLSLSVATSFPDPSLDPRQPSCCTLQAGFDPLAVANQAKRLASHSWEYGTAAEALLELYNPSLTVFSRHAFPHGKLPQIADPTSIQSLAYAKPHIRLHNTTLVDGDGAAGDPASLGSSAVLIGQSRPAYLRAATRQYRHLVNDVPRWPNGAISHREAYAELWADFMFMAPPFFAAYAVAVDSKDALLRVAVPQCMLYRQVLKPNSTAPSSYAADSIAGSWQHIIGPETQDPGRWSTGNGWAAMGMSRVLATVAHWDRTASSKAGKTAMGNLLGWIGEIVEGAMGAGKEESSGLVRNYLDDDTWFGEISGTSAMAAAVYRAAVLQNEMFGRGRKVITPAMVAWADASRAAVAKHVNSDGLASPAVNPLGWGDRTPYTQGSPEGQSFIVMMYSAWRDCVKARVCKK